MRRGQLYRTDGLHKLEVGTPGMPFLPSAYLAPMFHLYETGSWWPLTASEIPLGLCGWRTH